MHVYISIFLTREHNNAMKIFHFSCIYLQLCFRMSTKRLPCVMLVLDRLPKEIGTCVPLTHFAETTSLARLCHISTRIIPHFHMRRRNFKSCRLVFLHTHTNIQIVHPAILHKNAAPSSVRRGRYRNILQTGQRHYWPIIRSLITPTRPPIPNRK